MKIQNIQNVNYLNLKRKNLERKPDIPFSTNPHLALNIYLNNKATLNAPMVSFGNKSKIEFQKAATFEESLDKYYKFKPDKYQKEAAASLWMGDNVVVTAPTGTGKTLIAEYVINKNLAEGKTTYYTTPLKALSNQKYRDFCKQFGEENVGILTGDIKEKPNKPVIVMTTEIYRNMLLSDNQQKSKEQMKNLATVVYDEFHYMNDKDRGKTWEESIMYTPVGVQSLALSATADNDEAVVNWLNRINKIKAKEIGEEATKETRLVHVDSKERHVPLKYYIFQPERPTNLTPLTSSTINFNQLNKDYAHYLKTGVLNENLSLKQAEVMESIEKELGKDILVDLFKYSKSDITTAINKLKKAGMTKLEAERAAEILKDATSTKLSPDVFSKKISLERAKKTKQNQKNKGSKETNKKSYVVDLIKTMGEQNKLPAIIFIFNKKKCQDELTTFLSTGRTLLNEQETEEAKEIIEKYQEKGIYLGTNADIEGLLSGVAVHNAGMMPGYKSLVETLFQKKLVKTVFATETLAAGINMPAKTTVLVDLNKSTGLDKNGNLMKRSLTTSEFQQMSGRAGRRGIDPVGNVIIVSETYRTPEHAFKLATNRPDALHSSFTPSYSFLSHFIALTKSTQNIDSAIDKSFINDDYEAQGKDPSKYIFWLKNKFNLMTNVIMNPSLKLFEGDETHLKPTIKGDVVSKVRGSNELLFTESLFNAGFEKLTPAQLAAAVSTLTFADNVEAFKNLDIKLDNQTSNSINKISALNGQLASIQAKAGLNEEDYKTDLNLYPSQFILEWAKCQTENDAEAENAWSDLIYGIQQQTFKLDEGSFMRFVNQTIDMLNQVAVISRDVAKNAKYNGDKELTEKMYVISENAKQAVTLLKKHPIGDSLPNVDE